jgi:L-malate glycosyltransferase
MTQINTSQKRRILILNTQMEAGGAQKSLLILAQGLTRRGHSVTVVTMYDKNSYIPIFRNQYGVPIVDLQMKVQGNALRKTQAFLRGLKKLYDTIRQNDIDTLQTFNDYSNIIGPFIGWLAAVPVRVSSERGMLRNVNGVVRLLDRFITNTSLVHIMTTVSESMRDFCVEEQRIKPEKIVIIPNSVDVQKYSLKVNLDQKNQFIQQFGIDAYSFIVTIVARLSLVKGHMYLLQAIPRILQRLPDVHFLIVGDGPLHAQFKKRIEDENINTHVHMLGVRHDVPMILACSDLFVLASLSEGMPNVILEAMAAGVPIVATKVGSVPEIIENEEIGLLIPPADPQALALAVIELAKNPTKMARMSLLAQQKAISEFSQDRNISAYESLYEKLHKRH